LHADELVSRLKLHRFADPANRCAGETCFFVRLANRRGFRRFARFDVAFGEDPERAILLRANEQYQEAVAIFFDGDPACLFDAHR